MVRVIDSSVAIKWFVQEEGRERALGILKELLDSPRDFAVPELFYFELVHVFNRVLPQPTEAQSRLLERVLLIGLPRHPMSRELLRETTRFQRMGLSGYDGAYVGLAKILRGRWITFDHRAHTLVAHLNLSEGLTLPID